MEESCDARTIFWPDIEACEATCSLTREHDPFDRHKDKILGEWSEDELQTWKENRS